MNLPPIFYQDRKLEGFVPLAKFRHKNFPRTTEERWRTEFLVPRLAKKKLTYQADPIKGLVFWDHQKAIRDVMGLRNANVRHSVIHYYSSMGSIRHRESGIFVRCDLNDLFTFRDSDYQYTQAFFEREEDCMLYKLML